MAFRVYMTCGNSVVFWVSSLVVWVIVTICDLWTVNVLAEVYSDHVYSLDIEKLMVSAVFMEEEGKANGKNLRAAMDSLSMSLGISGGRAAVLFWLSITLMPPLTLSFLYLSWGLFSWFYPSIHLLLLKVPTLSLLQVIWTNRMFWKINNYTIKREDFFKKIIWKNHLRIYSIVLVLSESMH